MLTVYRGEKPDATWEEMRDDPFHSGQQAARETKTTLVCGQRCLCAFCEVQIAADCSDAAILERKAEQRVEHFHPKADTARPPNWNLHWPNLWAVCLGGSKQDDEAQENVRYPLPENLSCDAFKDHQIATGALAKSPEGWVLAPDELPAFPLLFQYSPEGAPEPHSANCAITVIPNHHYADTSQFVAKTIEHLNLGCFRLNEARRIVRAQLDKQIESVRKAAPGEPPGDVLLRLARRLFSANPDTPWPQFFSLVRWKLGPVAEQRLQEIQFTG
jgi:uncharacterized protein (TIGR02646 family)